MTALAKLERALQDIKKAVKDLNDLLEKTARLAGSAADAMSGMRGGRGGGGGSVTPRGGGASRGATYAQYAARRQQNAQYRAQYQQQYGQPQNPLMNLISRSRIDPSGKLMPLMMDIFKIVPKGVALLGAGVAVLARMGDDYIQRFRQTAATGGIGGAGGVMATGAAVGGDVSGIGRNLMSGYGPMYAAQAGVNPLGGPFGDNDYNRKVLKLLQLIASQKSFNQARAIAEALGSPEAANVWFLNKGTRERLIQSGEGSPKTLRRQQDLDAQVQTAKNYIGRDVADFMRSPKHGIAIILSWFNSLEHAFDPKSWDKHQEALDKNTAATDANTRSMNQGTFGGGPNAQGAIPRAHGTAGFYQNNPGYSSMPYGILP